MADLGNGDRRYTISFSAATATVIRHVHRRAKREGRGDAVTEALRQLRVRLESDPFQVGEPDYRLPALHMEVRTVIVRPLVVYFAISEEHRLIFLKGMVLMPA
jgi:hypothetical protein